MFKIFKYITPKEWLMAAISLAFIVAQVWLELRVPEYMTRITELTQTPGSEMSEILINGGYMLLCTLGSLATAVVVGFFAARISASFSQRLRSMLFNKVESFSMEEINRFSTSSLITRSTNDITQVQMLIVMGMMVIFRAPIMAVWAITRIADKGFEWSMVTASGVVLMLLVFCVMMIFVVPKFRIMQRLTDNITRVTRENLTGVRVVRAYNAEDYQEAKFETANEELTATHLFTARAMAIVMPIMNMMMGGMNLAIYWIGAYLIDDAGMTIGASGMLLSIELFGNMVVFMQYSMMVVMSFMMLVMIFVMLPRAGVAAKRINEVLDTDIAIKDGAVTSGLEGCVGEVEFRNVSFKYPDADEDSDYVLHNVSFTAKKGETVAFIGSTGSGKSTLIMLILRFYDVTEGEILVDGVNVKDYTLEALYEKIGYVPQKAVLFKGTVASNVAFGGDFEWGSADGGEKILRCAQNDTGDEAQDDTGDEAQNDTGDEAQNDVREKVAAAVRVAQGSDFVEEMEDTYDAEISQGGVNLSGGQKQRLAIARAVCRAPEFYIFDDSFSALDFKTDRVLRNELKRETAGVTNLIVAQRIGTIMDADRIVVLDEGEVMGIGEHRELLQSCEVYREIAQSQLSDSELEIRD